MSTSDTPTPRANALIMRSGFSGLTWKQQCSELFDLARQLERELAEARKDSERLRLYIDKAYEALDVCRVSYENRGDYFDGWATNAMREMRAAKVVSVPYACMADNDAAREDHP